MIVDYLIKHAQENVWCMPFQDNQAILALSRISRDGGEVGSVLALWGEQTLPTRNDAYHVYMVGQNFPLQWSLPQTKGKWVSLQTWGKRNQQIIDLYLQNGKHLPLSTAFIYRADDLNFLIAVLQVPSQWSYTWNTVGGLNVEQLYLRLYRNAYFETDKAHQEITSVEYGGGLVRNQSDITRLQNEVANLRFYDGVVNVYHNGYWISDILSTKIKVGDFVEWVHDVSVARVVDFDVNTLLDFASELDNIRKYLLHPSKNGNTGETIRYRDDVDIYLFTEDSEGWLKGRYYHRNREGSMRMVTHADYSVPVDFVQAYLDKDNWAELKNLKLRLHIRDSGLDRPLVHETNRIHELYKLSDRDIVRAMLGLDATVDIWQVQHLEKSLYTAMMRSYFGKFEIRDVLEAYGYNAVTKLLDDTPYKVTVGSNGNYVEVTPGLVNVATMFEYDAGGLLLGAYDHGGDTRYYTRNPECMLVEALVGKGQKQLDWVAGNDPVTLGNYLYGFYFCKKVKDVPTNDWQLAVKDKHYTLLNGVVSWIHDAGQNQGLVVSDKSFLLYNFDFPSNNDVYTFTLTHSDVNGTVLPIQPEHLNIWLNRRFLIEGLDYTVVWPKVTLISKPYLKLGVANQLVVRATGFYGKSLTRRIPVDSGFAYQGLVSLNGHYDLRDDKVMRVVIGGGVFHTDDVPFAERAGETGLLAVQNGTPYMSEVVNTPIREITTEVNWILKDAAEAVDQALEDYMTVKYPEIDKSGPNPIGAYYGLYSPVLTAVAYDLQRGALTSPYSPQDPQSVSDKLKPYFPLLDFDPCRKTVNTNYVRIYPTPFDVIKSVSERDFLFLTAINKLYLNSRLDISSFFRIEGTS